jgi:hypothetical protein
MANELLVTRDLNREMIDAGTALADELESQRFNATAVLWLYFEESERWRIVVGSPDVGKLGPRKVYENIQALLDGMGDDASGLRLENISAVYDKAFPIKALREHAAKSGGIEAGRVMGPVSGAYIDAYIYMVKPLEAGRKN